MPRCRCTEPQTEPAYFAFSYCDWLIRNVNILKKMIVFLFSMCSWKVAAFLIETKSFLRVKMFSKGTDLWHGIYLKALRKQLSVVKSALQENIQELTYSKVGCVCVRWHLFFSTFCFMGTGGQFKASEIVYNLSDLTTTLHLENGRGRRKKNSESS